MWPSAVHPRERGEHAADESKYFRVRGSSPRARGTPARNSDPVREVRFIPASAGNTETHGR